VPEFLLSLFLLAYNNILNFWRPYHGWIYVPLNVTTTSAVAGLMLLVFDQTPASLGLVKPASSLVGLAIGVAASVPFFVALVVPGGSRLIADRRFGGESGTNIAYRMVIRVPLGTALLEEVAFRGALFAILAPRGTWFAVLVSSTVFGLWHVSPTIQTVLANRPEASRAVLTKVVLAAVVLAAIAGLLLATLRALTGSLAAPFGLHATFNALTTLAAWLAWRRVPAIVEA
jgi:membrane protease YdiL (CAAX protease family)